MRAITEAEAANAYGITTRHQVMPNGELRFRLLKDDGTAYIRTEAGAQGAWQSSHYHRHLCETYIVQQGWIALAELAGGESQLTTWHTGEQFTIAPGTVHNVYMPAGSVIHTVKHGSAAQGDRHVDEATLALDSSVAGIAEHEILARSNPGRQPAQSSEVYSAEYRHFDTLIWQLPTWCTAILLIAIAGIGSTETAKFVENAADISPTTVMTGFYVFLLAIILAFSFVLFRFRMHQRPLKRYSATPFWASAQTYLQLIMTLEVAAVSFIVLVINRFPLQGAIVLCALLVLTLTLLQERRLRAGPTRPPGGNCHPSSTSPAASPKRERP